MEYKAQCAQGHTVDLLEFNQRDGQALCVQPPLDQTIQLGLDLQHWKVHLATPRGTQALCTESNRAGGGHRAVPTGCQDLGEGASMCHAEAYTCRCG